MLLLLVKATNLDKLARDKEAKFASEQKANERKAELLVRLQQIGDEEKKVGFVKSLLHTIWPKYLTFRFLASRTNGTIKNKNSI